MAKKDPSAVNVAHMLKRTDSKSETHTNGSELHSNIMNVSLQVIIIIQKSFLVLTSCKLVRLRHSPCDPKSDIEVKGGEM